MRERIDKPEKFNTCFGCGSANAFGLALVFYREDDSVVAEFTPRAEFGGFGKVLHGGVTSSLIDESFGWAIFGLLGKLGMTTTLTVGFRSPIFCGEPSTVRCRVESHDGRQAHLRAEVRDARGELAAEGTGILRFVSARAVERIGGLEFGPTTS
jgi:acyl-coenzyme A thioesterase PaaI-like protein